MGPLPLKAATPPDVGVPVASPEACGAERTLPGDAEQGAFDEPREATKSSTSGLMAFRPSLGSSVTDGAVGPRGGPTSHRNTPSTDQQLDPRADLPTSVRELLPRHVEGNYKDVVRSSLSPLWSSVLVNCLLDHKTEPRPVPG